MPPPKSRLLSSNSFLLFIVIFSALFIYFSFEVFCLILWYGLCSTQHQALKFCQLLLARVRHTQWAVTTACARAQVPATPSDLSVSGRAVGSGSDESGAGAGGGVGVESASNSSRVPECVRVLEAAIEQK